MGVGREEKGAGETWRRRRRRGGGARPGGSQRARARPPASLATQATPWEEEDEAFVSFFFSFFLFSFCLRGRIAMIGCVYYYETRKKAYISLMRQPVRKADFFSRRL